MLTVAIASENDAYDGVIFERLLRLTFRPDVARWKTDMRISGCDAVVRLADPFLRQASAAGIRHALFVVDNDGGSIRGPEHEPDHDRAAQAADPDGCRMCRILGAIPPWWADDARNFCAAVPVQTVETWLLWLRDDLFDGEPEKIYHRWVLKKRFFGKPLPGEAERARLALVQIERPQALERLRARRSFRLFEEQLGEWAAHLP